MDLGSLNDNLDQEANIDSALNSDYITSIGKRQPRSKLRQPLSMSRQNSTQSIGSLNLNKPHQPKLNLGFPSPKYSDLSIQKDIPRQQPKKTITLFGAHKDTAATAKNYQDQSEKSFMDFFGNQNSAKPPLPDSKTPLPEKKNILGSPESILDDDINNNSSMASRRGRPPLNRKNQPNENEIQQNRSENFTTAQSSVAAPVLSSVPKQQTAQSEAKNSLTNDSIEELKKVFANQLQFQKQGFESLLKKQRQSHQHQIKDLREFHSEQVKKKLEIKDFELEKVKQFYELQLKLQRERQLEIKEYSLINKKLAGNIESIEKLEKNFKDSEFRNRSERQDEVKKALERKDWELKQKETELKEMLVQLDQQRLEFKNHKTSLAQSIDAQKARLYELQVDLRKKQSELQTKYKKLETSLAQEYQNKARQIQKQWQQLRMSQLNVKEQRNIIEIQKLEVINSRKLWDSEKKAYLEQLHQQKTKVLEKEIQIASRTGQIEIKEQQVQMHQNDYLNKLKLIELEKKKLDIQKNNSRGQLYLSATSGAFKTHGLLGTSLLNKTNTLALHRQFYSNDSYDQQPLLNEETNYKKSITQMRDDFLKTMPKF